MASENKKLAIIDVKDVTNSVNSSENIPTYEEEYSIENDEKTIESKDSEYDAAFKLANESKQLEITDEINKNLLRKIDIYLQPVLWAVYTLQYMDKVTNSYAGVMGIQKDLKMTSSQFSWLGSAFYLAYLIVEFPYVRILQHFPLVKILSISVVIWGIVLACHSAAQNPAGILVCRSALGIFESCITPGFILLTSQWYKKEEQFARIAYWFSCNGFGSIIGGSIAYGLAHHEKSLPIESWRILFIITGVLTIAFGIVIWFYIPDTPNKAWFLNNQEKLYVVERIRSNQQGFGTKKFKWYQFREAFIDPRTWLYIIWGLTAQIPNGGFGSFGSILLHSTLGYSSQMSLLMGLPQGAVQVISGIITGYIATKTQKRVVVGSVCCMITLAGGCMLAFSSDRHVQLAGYYIFPFYAIGMVTILSLISSDAAGHTKKSTVSAAYLVSYCVGNLIGPQTFRAKDAPMYYPARVTIAACLAVCTIDLSLLFILNLWENKRRDCEEGNEVIQYSKKQQLVTNYEFLDLTDFENKKFRYSL